MLSAKYPPILPRRPGSVATYLGPGDRWPLVIEPGMGVLYYFYLLGEDPD